MKKEMLINVLQPEECRIAIVEDGVLEELYVERSNQESYVGNIYKGRIVNIEPGIQAAFVDFGIGRNGFLHISDVDPVYYKHLLPKEILAQMEADDDEEERSARSRPERTRDRDRRPPRYAPIESEVTLPTEPTSALPPSHDTEDPEEGDFGVGLLEEDDDEIRRDDGAEVALVGSESPRSLPPILPLDPPADAPESPTASAATHTVANDPDAEEDFGFEDFGAGLLDGDEPTSSAVVEPVVNLKPTPEPALDPSPEPAVEADAPLEANATATSSVGSSEVEAEAKPRPKRTSSKPKPKPKAEEPATEEEPKKTAKPRRGRKKADDGDDSEKPRPLDSAEYRTSGEDDPEIVPFFEPAGSFDIDAPNDRFVDPDLTADPLPPGYETADGFDSATDPLGFADPLSPGTDEFAAPAVPTDNYDEYEPAPAPARERDRGRGDRDRNRGDWDRGRGDRDRGGRGRGERYERGGDRNDRGGRSGGTARGPMSRERDRGFPKPNIQDIFKRGQEVIVQVIKEAIGTKAPNLSTFISIAGRYLVLMPSLNRVGVSRKIEDVDARKRLREIMTRLNPPKGVGFIVRTAAIDRNEAELQNDLAYLLRLWQVVARRIKKMPSPVEIYRESDMITRTIRDNFTSDINTIWVDEANAFAHASEFLQIVMPRFADRIRYFSDTEPLFNKYGVEEEIAKINHKRIDLPQGGSIIIEQTEALVAIDVNSGNFRADNNAEETAYQLNLIAAKEIARQLRLRDLGGVIVNDFIDMRSESHRRRVEDTLRTALKRDRARTKILRISQFGIIEMTRQRIQPSLKKRIFVDCPHCKGTGYVKTNETIGIEVMRLIQLAAHRTPLITQMSITVHNDAAFYLLNRKRKEIAALEERAKMEIQIHGLAQGSPEHLEFRCMDGNGNPVQLFDPPALRGGSRPALPRHERERDRDRRMPNLNESR